ncbi:ATP-binding protein [Streptomyces griseoluteus]|uniref:ATP-binding protein n=1 Tax=Streptomyces griseoluteus TaxID=29306 RepID=UPI003EC0E2D3
MISHPNRHCTVELQALPSRIGQVRRIVSAQLRYWRLDPLIDRAALGVTELLSNVHRHARPDKSCVVELEFQSDRLTVSVRDRDPRLPVVTDSTGTSDAGPLATCGRGLVMVAAVSESWGCRPDGEDGKVVWFALSARAATAPRPPAPKPLRAAEQRPEPAPLTVQPPVRAPEPVVVHAPAPEPSVAHGPARSPEPAVAHAPAGAPAPEPALAHAAAEPVAPEPAPPVVAAAASATSAVPG